MMSFLSTADTTETTHQRGATTLPSGAPALWPRTKPRPTRSSAARIERVGPAPYPDKFRVAACSGLADRSTRPSFFSDIGEKGGGT